VEAGHGAAGQIHRTGSAVRLRYGIDDLPPFRELLFFGLQWLAIAIPGIVIIGKVVSGLYSTGPADEIAYLQKLSFVVAVVLPVQVFAGHRLPLIVGPSSVLLVGTIASAGFGPGSVYTATMLGGAVLFVAAITGLFGRLQRLFTVRVVSVVLLLIGFTLIPTVLALLTPTGPVPVPVSLFFAFILVFSMFAGQRWLPPALKSTVVFLAMIVGSIAWFVLLPPGRYPVSSGPVFHSFLDGFTTHLEFVPGVLIAFLICYFGLSVNDLGSIESVSTLLDPSDMSTRVNRGIAVTGLANLLSGFLGVIGQVNFSLSPGVILSTGSGSRFTLVPTAVFLGILSFSPFLMGFVATVPSVVTGAIFVYVLAFQVAAGLRIIAQSRKGSKLGSGLVIGLPVFLGTAVSFLPVRALSGLPGSLRPVLGNGFVTGVVAALILDRVVHRK
jgi:xanthine/uracil permease